MSTKKPQSMSAHRLKDNPEEKRFADAWSREASTLAWLLDPNHGASHYPVEPSERDAVVAATIIQWLGSPVGRVFLEELGYVRADKLIDHIEMSVPYVLATISQNNTFAITKLEQLEGASLDADTKNWRAAHAGRLGSSHRQLETILKLARELKR